MMSTIIIPLTDEHYKKQFTKYTSLQVFQPIKGRNIRTRIRITEYTQLVNNSVAPIIGSAIGYHPIIGIVMHIGISGAYPYRSFFLFFWISLYFPSI